MTKIVEPERLADGKVFSDLGTQDIPAVGMLDAQVVALRSPYFKYNDNPVEVDPGAGYFTINTVQASQNTATVIWINDAGINGGDIGEYINGFAVGTVLRCVDVSDPSNYFICKLSNFSVDNTGWWKLFITHLEGTGLIDESNYRIENLGLADLGVVGQVYSKRKANVAPTGTTQAIDWNDGMSQVIELGSATGDVTLSFSNPKDGASYLLKFIQGATFRDVVLPSNVLIPDGSAPNTLDITATPSAVDVFTLWYDGTNYHAQLAQNFG